MKKILFLIAILFVLPQFIFAQMMNVHFSDGSVQEFHVSEVDSVTFTSKVGTLKWMGQSSLKIKTNEGLVIYIDPYAGTDYSEPADIIFVSHGHSDHNQVGKVTKKDDCKIISGPGANVGGTKMSAGDTAEELGIKITAVQAYNGNHPKGTGVGFVLEINGIKIYHCGDTSKIDEMAELADMNIDYAFLCIDGKYNMGPKEAMECAEIIKAKKVIPFHTGFSEAEKKANIENFTPPNKLIMNEGDTIYL